MTCSKQQSDDGKFRSTLGCPGALSNYLQLLLPLESWRLELACSLDWRVCEGSRQQAFRRLDTATMKRWSQILKLKENRERERESGAHTTGCRNRPSCQLLADDR